MTISSSDARVAALAALTVDLEWESVRAPALITDLAAKTAIFEVTFDPTNRPLIGDVLAVHFQTVDPGNTVTVPAVVTGLRRLSDKLHVGTRFTDTAPLTPHLTPKLRELFNRRMTYRAMPRRTLKVDLRPPLKGDVKDRSLTLSARHGISVAVMDVSAGGMKLLLDPRFAIRFDIADKTFLRFRVPGERRPILFAAQVRYKHDWTNARGRALVAVGVTFDEAFTDDIEGKRRQLAKYVLDVQQEELKAAQEMGMSGA